MDRTIDDCNAEIAALEARMRRLQQQMNAKQQERAQAFAKIKRIKQRAESRRVHKMIVLGSAVLSAYVRLFGLTADEEEEILSDDKRLARFGMRLVEYAIAYKKMIKNSDNV